MSRHRYPTKSLLADYARAGFGLLFVGYPLLAADISGFVVYAFMALAALFVIYGARTILRQTTVIEMDEQGVRALGTLPAGVAWDNLSEMDLRYFSTRRDRHGGWLHLRLKDSNGKIGFDSALDGFDALAAAAGGAARRAGLELNERTVTNLRSIGIDLAPIDGDDQPKDGAE